MITHPWGVCGCVPVSDGEKQIGYWHDVRFIEHPDKVPEKCEVCGLAMNKAEGK